MYSELLSPVLSSRTWCVMWTDLDSTSVVVSLASLQEPRVRSQIQMQAGLVGGSSCTGNEVSSGLGRGERAGMAERMEV